MSEKQQSERSKDSKIPEKNENQDKKEVQAEAKQNLQDDANEGRKKSAEVNQKGSNQKGSGEEKSSAEKHLPKVTIEDSKSEKPKSENSKIENSKSDKNGDKKKDEPKKEGSKGENAEKNDAEKDDPNGLGLVGKAEGVVGAGLAQEAVGQAQPNSEIDETKTEETKSENHETELPTIELPKELLVDEADKVHRQLNPSYLTMTNDDQTINTLNGRSKEELRMLDEIYKERYGVSMREAMKFGMSTESNRRVDAMFNGERDPGYLSPTGQDAQKALDAFKNGPSDGKALDYYIDAEQLKAIQKNEVSKRGLEDDIQDMTDLKNSTKGPAQISDDLVKELSQDPRFKEKLAGVDPKSVDGSQMYMAAAMTLWVDRLNQGYFNHKAQEKLQKSEEPGQTEEQVNKLREDAAWMTEQQARWEKAVAEDDKDTMRRMLARRWNPGNGTQEDEVEAQRGATPQNSVTKRAMASVKTIYDKVFSAA